MPINKQPKKTTTKAKKIKVVEELSEKVAKAKSLVFTNYQGLTHHQLETLKKELRKVDAELIVAKNSLLTLALKKVSKDEKVSNVSNGGSKNAPSDTFDTSASFDTSHLTGPTATLFAYSDVIAPLKALAKSIKELKRPEIKFGILDGKVVNADQVNKLSILPSKEVLIAQVVGGIKSPLFGLHRALNWNIQKFVMTLSAIQQKKS